MKTICLMALAGLLAFCITVYAAPPPASLSQVPEFINYQGRLVEPDGTPYSNATHTIEMRLYESASGGSAVWAEEYTVNTQDGYFSLLLGSGGTPIDGSTNELWQVIWSQGGGGSSDSFFMGLTLRTSASGLPLLIPVEASPRQQFVTTPFAFRSHQSVFAAGAADEFQATSGINTPSINSPGDVVVTAPMRITGSGNKLYANRITSNESNPLEIIGQPGQEVEITGDGGGMRVGFATPSGESTVIASSVTVGHSSGGSTSINGENTYVTAATDNTLRMNVRNGTMHVGYNPTVVGPITLLGYGPNTMQIGYSYTDVNINSDNFDFNGLPFFDFDKVYFAGTGVNTVQVSVPGISSSQYDLMIVGYDCTVTPKSVFMLNGTTARIEFNTTVNSVGFVHVLGIRKGLMVGHEY